MTGAQLKATESYPRYMCALLAAALCYSPRNMPSVAITSKPCCQEESSVGSHLAVSDAEFGEINLEVSCQLDLLDSVLLHHLCVIVSEVVRSGDIILLPYRYLPASHVQYPTRVASHILLYTVVLPSLLFRCAPVASDA